MCKEQGHEVPLESTSREESDLLWTNAKGGEMEFNFSPPGTDPSECLVYLGKGLVLERLWRSWGSSAWMPGGGGHRVPVKGDPPGASQPAWIKVSVRTSGEGRHWLSPAVLCCQRSQGNKKAPFLDAWVHACM